MVASTALINAVDGTSVAQFEYGPFGEEIRGTGPARGTNPLRFSAKYQDDETDLLYYGKRYLNTSTGRWLGHDPLVNRVQRSRNKHWLREQSNPYHFTFNDAVNRLDVLGLAVNDVQVVSIACPRTCGPDYTAAVNAVIAALRTYMDAGPDTPTGDSLVFDGLNTGVYLSWFRQVAASLNYAEQANNAAKNASPFTGCPTAACAGMITLCGKCVSSDVPGNIMFGFISTASGAPQWLRNAGADYAEATDGDGEGDVPWWLGGGITGVVIGADEDRDVFPLGDQLYESGSNDICSVLSKLPNHAKSSCRPCTQKRGIYNPQFPFQRIPYPIYY